MCESEIEPYTSRYIHNNFSRDETSELILKSNRNNIENIKIDNKSNN